MNNKTTTVVIAAGVVLAAVIVTRTPAQEQEVGQGACCYPSGGCLEFGASSCISTGGTFQGSGTTCAETDCTPQPTVVGVTINGDWIIRGWSDGQVDVTPLSYGGPCGTTTALCPPLAVIPGTCPTDIDRDGDTGINDFLTLLGGWGACR